MRRRAAGLALGATPAFLGYGERLMCAALSEGFVVDG
jgi:hypothetical protein